MVIAASTVVQTLSAMGDARFLKSIFVAPKSHGKDECWVDGHCVSPSNAFAHCMSPLDASAHSAAAMSLATS